MSDDNWYKKELEKQWYSPEHIRILEGHEIFQCPLPSCMKQFSDEGDANKHCAEHKLWSSEQEKNYGMTRFRTKESRKRYEQQLDKLRRIRESSGQEGK